MNASSYRPLRVLAAASALLAAAALRADDDTIKVGEYGSLTGKEASFGQSAHKGIVMAVEEINAAGGVLGRKLELVTEDNQTIPGQSATAAKKLISRD
jgi:branched-chain amino acid transport system substrate-binding protein